MLFKKSSPLFLALIVALAFLDQAYAEEFYCEVMSLQGNAYLTNKDGVHQPVKEGDILKVDDQVEVDNQSYLDLAYDRDWTNVVRVEESSRIRIKSVHPAQISLQRGGLFAKLKSLPKESTFEVQTPTALAAVRGTEFQTLYGENGTEVLNFSNSDVFVYGLGGCVA